MKQARNVAILVALAVAVVAVPGGTDTAGLIGAILSLAIVAVITVIAGRLYREHRLDLYALGDRDRASLYVAVAAVVLLLAASGRLLASPGGTLGEIAGLALCGGLLLRVYRNWQRY